MKQITPAQAMQASFTQVKYFQHSKDKPARIVGTYSFDRFLKPAETQDKAIKRLMSGVKRNAQAAPKRVFPTAAADLVSPQAYARAYYRLNNLGSPDGLFHLSSRPTEYPEGPEVIFTEEAAEVEEDFADIL